MKTLHLDRSAVLACALGLTLGCATTPTRPERTAPAPAPAPKLSAEPASAKVAPTSASITPTKAPVQKSAIPNGPIPFRPLRTPAPMTTVVQPEKNDPIVSFRLVFHSGSVDDPPGKAGLTALTARLMAEGGTRSLTADQLTKALYPMAAELSVHPGKEFTTFQGRVHEDFLKRYLPILEGVLTAPRLDPTDFARLKAQAIARVRNGLRGNDDERLGKVALDALLYPHHPYGHWVNGTVKGLESVTLDDVKAQMKRVFTQDRLVVGLAGAVNDALAQKLKKALSALPAKGAPLTTLPPAPRVTDSVLILQKPALSTAISMGYAYGLRRGDPDFFKVAFAVSYLGEHRQFSGLLMQELREKRGLNYGDYAYAEHFTQAGGSTYARSNLGRSEQDFSIWLRPVVRGNAMFATRGALWFLEDMLKNGIPEKKLELTRSFLEGYTHLWEQTDQRRLGDAIDGLFYGTPHFLDAFRAAMKTMTPASVLAAARRHLDPSRMSFVFVSQDAQKLAKALAAETPSPMKYPSPKSPDVLKVDQRFTALKLPVDPSRIRVVKAESFMEGMPADSDSTVTQRDPR